jgi:hypothetical protein
MDVAHGKVTAYKDPKLPAAPAVSDGPGWAAGLRNINAADADTLVAVIRTLYPHDGLPETIYRRVVVRFDRLAAVPAAAALLAGFCKDVSAGWPIPFSDLAETYRVQALKTLEAGAAFFFVQRMAVRYLYDDVELWAAFGYEGASVHLGGYVKRGFDDLDWLPPLPNDL